MNTMIWWLGLCHGNDSFTESLVQFFYSFTCTLPPLPLPLCSRLAVDYLIDWYPVDCISCFDLALSILCG